MSKTYKGVVLEFYHGDITKLEVDAIVNAANTKLVMGGGVAGAIKRAGGVEIEKEAVAKGPIKIGEAVETTAGRLKAKYVIHTPTMELDFKTDENKIRLAMKAALNKAKELDIRSIAFPALGTGVGGFSKAEAAKIMIEEIKKVIDEGTSLERIVLADISAEQVEEYRKKAEELL
ncbi:putative phosphatase-like protein [Archaeoglobus sulfaticallidus PM70-1]|uniref:Putative phosphatase-like protein n=1 Tax=Archaeoglobus sulfaticallidus PM70-1 TaxID=387631 RepID=N0BCX3_9EURY|nr:macro domain-containing protein [Archaeoglobus sulfaticallidus]AGK61459.1 putative phosphatase-like protein [Archaeoglobus sulfaticallidus PM70-1]